MNTIFEPMSQEDYDACVRRSSRKNLPFFAPYHFGPYVMHGEPISDESLMVWVYDSRLYDDGPMESCVRVEFEYVTTTNRNKLEKQAWRIRNQIVADLAADQPTAMRHPLSGPKAVVAHDDQLIIVNQDPGDQQ